jgi:N-acetylglutamate synthase
MIARFFDRRSDLVRGLQERTTRGFPATYTRDVDGWLLRAAPDCAWWVGTTLAHRVVRPGGLLRRVVEAEEFYAGHGAVPRFQVSPGVSPHALDAVLAERGYRRQSPMSIQVASTARVRQLTSAAPVRQPAPAAPVPQLASTGELRLRVDDRPTRAWFDGWCAITGRSNGSQPEWDLLARVAPPAAYVSALGGDGVIAVGRAVAETGWAGVFGMGTLPEARGKGAARAVLGALADWAATHGADHMYLQVERANLPARRLYERTGFSDMCGYHYREAEAG